MPTATIATWQHGNMARRCLGSWATWPGVLGNMATWPGVQLGSYCTARLPKKRRSLVLTRDGYYTRSARTISPFWESTCNNLRNIHEWSGPVWGPGPTTQIHSHSTIATWQHGNMARRCPGQHGTCFFTSEQISNELMKTDRQVADKTRVAPGCPASHCTTSRERETTGG